jgi:murein L,D-transpeptidase YafK
MAYLMNIHLTRMEILIFLFISILSLELDPTFASDSVDLLLIEKSTRRLVLKSGDKEIGHYSISLGSSAVGPKRCQGDGKTPEGEYIIAGRNEKSAYHKSLRISYPNPSDVGNAAKLNCTPGGDIMIHGLPNGRGILGFVHTWFDWTQGCIAVRNNQIEEIWDLVHDGAKVKIVP